MCFSFFEQAYGLPLLAFRCCVDSVVSRLQSSGEEFEVKLQGTEGSNLSKFIEIDANSLGEKVTR